MALKFLSSLIFAVLLGLGFSLTAVASTKAPCDQLLLTHSPSKKLPLAYAYDVMAESSHRWADSDWGRGFIRSLAEAFEVVDINRVRIVPVGRWAPGQDVLTVSLSSEMTYTVGYWPFGSYELQPGEVPYSYDMVQIDSDKSYLVVRTNSRLLVFKLK